MHVEICEFLEVELREISVVIPQDIASLFESARTKPSGRGVFRGVRPSEVVEPGARGDVAENRAAIDVADLAGAVNVVEQFVIVGGVK